MKHIFLLLSMLAMAASAHSQDYLKLMSYNIRNTKGMDNVRNVQRIANVINNEAPDVVAVQELDSMTTRSNQTDVLAEVAERTQMHANSGVDCHFLLQRVFPTQGSNVGVPHCRKMLYHLSHQGSLS